MRALTRYSRNAHATSPRGVSHRLRGRAVPAWNTTRGHTATATMKWRLVLCAAACSALRLPPALSRKETVRGALAGALLPQLPPLNWLPAATAAAPLATALCDPAVSVLRQGDKEVTLIGTAHISDESAALVRRVIRQVQPDTVMIELDRERAGRIPGVMSTDGSGNAPADSPPRSYGAGQIAMRLLRGDVSEASTDAVGLGLSSLYKSLDGMGFQSGNEFVVAVEEAQRLQATVLLGDRPVRVTLGRLRDALGSLLATAAEAKARGQEGTAAPPALLAEAGLTDSSELTYENVKTTMTVLKERQNVRALVSYMKAEANPMYEALIGERDAYMVCLGATARAIVARAIIAPPRPSYHQTAPTGTCDTTNRGALPSA